MSKKVSSVASALDELFRTHNRCSSKEVCESTGPQEMPKRSIQRASTEFIDQINVFNL
eukprot:SAG31_NODE_1250_length_9118_cov_4.047344_8_plen_58_part_00